MLERIVGGRSATVFFAFALLFGSVTSSLAQKGSVASRSGTTVSEIDLKEIPTARDPWDILRQTPGVISDRPATTSGTTARRTYTIDGLVVGRIPTLSVVSPPANAAYGNSDVFDFDAIRELQVTTGGTDAEYGRFGGGVVNVITKSGGNEFEGTGRFFGGEALWGDYYLVDPPTSFAGGEILIDLGQRPGGTACLDGFRFVDENGNPIPELNDLAEGSGFGLALESPYRFVARGDGLGLDLDGDGVRETRIVDVPACDGGPNLGLLDLDFSYQSPTHLFVGENGTFPVDLGAKFPFEKIHTRQTDQEPDGGGGRILDTSLYVNGNYRYVDGIFELVPGDPPADPPIGKAGIDGFGVLGVEADYFGVGAGDLGAGVRFGGQPTWFDTGRDRPGSGSGSTWFLRISDLDLGCPGVFGGFFQPGRTGPGGGTLVPDPAARDVECPSRTVFVNDRWRLNERWSFDLGPRYDGAKDDLRLPARIGFDPIGGQRIGDGPGALDGGPILRDRLWFWGSYGVANPDRILLNGSGALPFDSSWIGLPDGVGSTGSYLIPGDRAPVHDPEAGAFEWESFAPRVGTTYALGEERKTLLRASFSRFYDGLGSGFGAGAPNPFVLDPFDPSTPGPGTGIFGQGGFLIGGTGFDGPAPSDGEPPETGDPGSVRGIDFDGDGIPDTAILDLDDFSTGYCPTFPGIVGGFVPVGGDRLEPTPPSEDDCRIFTNSFLGIRDRFDLSLDAGVSWYALGPGREPDRDREPEIALDLALRFGPEFFLGSGPSPRDFTLGPVLDAPIAPGIQGVGVQFRSRYVGRRAAAPLERLAPGGAVLVEDPSPVLHFVARGGSTGEVFDLEIVHPASGPVPVEGYLAIEPVAATAADRARFEEELASVGGERETVTAAGYCLQFAAEAPPAGTVFRVADRAAQEAFAPMARALEAARELHEAGLLNPDTDPESYFHSIRQWAVWSLEKEFDAEGFVEAFLEHTRKNVEAAGRRWSGEIEEIVRRSARGRWEDVSRVLEKATS